SVFSDGYPSDWEKGCELASQVLNRQIAIPVKEGEENDA
ncbi:hypothetical protein LCGC14_2667860, partial [marine sediment metagenome]